MRTFCVDELATIGVKMRVAQANESQSHFRGTLRGLHYQAPPSAEIKLVRCMTGMIFDVIVDVRQDSPTLGKNFATYLRAGDNRLLIVPQGFAHGFLTLEDYVCVQYLVSKAYAPAAERGLRWNDPALGIKWPFKPLVISDRDRSYPSFGIG